MNNKSTLSIIISLSISLANNSMDERPKKRICLESYRYEYKKFKEAIDTGNLELMEKLIQEGVDPNCMIEYLSDSRFAYFNTGDMPALHYSILNDCDSKVIELLLKYVTDINITDDNHRNALFCAVEKGNLIIAHLLIKQGIDFNLKDNKGDTCLCKSYYRFVFNQNGIKEIRSLNIIHLLIYSGADINIKDSDDYSFLDLAKRSWDGRILAIILDWKNSITKGIRTYMPADLGNIVIKYVTG